MNSRNQRIRALSLLSGSLDSQWAAALLLDQGVELLGVAFSSPLFDGAAARPAAARLGVALEIVDMTPELLSILNASSCDSGGGEQLCRACRQALLRTAAKVVESLGCDFMGTGEVLNQDMACQSEEALLSALKTSGMDGWIVRPLSAKRLPPTEPERRGLLDRGRFLDLEGSGRRAQQRWAEREGIGGQPVISARGRLMDAAFIERVRDVQRHEGFRGVHTLAMLLLGRHFRLAPSVKLVLGRDEHENAEIEGAARPHDLILEAQDRRGPSGLLPFTASETEIRQAAAICVRYSDCPSGGVAKVRVRSVRETRWVEVRPAAERLVNDLRV